MKLLFAAFVLAVTGCGGDDAGGTTTDAAISGGACTNAVYDPCTSNAQCTSGNCHFFMQSNFQVCVQTCTPGNNTTCPVDSTGANGTCNNMGICKPAQANSCTR